MMEWNFNNETPIYLQIIDRFKMDIANGSLKQGNKVPSVRELAYKLCSEFCEGMSKVGFTPEQSLTVYENYLKSLKKE